MYEQSYYDDITFSTTGFYEGGERSITAHFPEGHFSLARDEQKWYQKMFGLRPKAEFVEGHEETLVLPENPNDFGMTEAKIWFAEIGLPDDFAKCGEAVLLVLKTHHKELLNEVKKIGGGQKFHSGGYIISGPGNVYFDGYYSTSGGVKLPSNVTSLLDLMPEFDREQKFKHPVSGREMDVTGAIMDLNDNHKWSREQIADWLDTLDADLSIGKVDG